MNSTATRMGLTQLLPITGAFALPFGLLHTALSLNIVYNRLSTGTYLGDKLSSSSQDPNYDPNKDSMFLATRVYANFTENVPFALFLASVVELNGGDRSYLTYTLGSLVVLRVAHVLGLGGVLPIQARAGGYYGTTAITTGLAGWAAWLCSGYWGF